MVNKDDILRALDELEKVQADLAAVLARTDDQRRYDLIQCRRKMSTQMAEVGRVADELFASLGRPELLQAYRDHFSRVRSAVATHQTNWPAVRLDEVGEEYARSTAAVYDANRDFFAWIRPTIGRL